VILTARAQEGQRADTAAPTSLGQRDEHPDRAPRRSARGRGATPSTPAGLLQRASLAVLLVGTGFLYLWNLSASGWANAFYSAAAQAGGESWEAWFFGSSDAANAITVDKAPAVLWVTGLSVRIFGLSSWSILVPQALMGIAAVGLLYATVRRTSGPAAGLLAGAVLALTPVATLMFRFNNPDALLVLLLVAAGTRPAASAAGRAAAGARRASAGSSGPRWRPRPPGCSPRR
jgi:hypothetical protein